MRRALVSLGLLLSLTSCSLTEPIPIKGEVVSCTSIKVQNSDSQPLDCLDGSNGVSVDSIVGPALINVWGSWCEPCKAEIPYLREFYDKYNDQVALVGLDVEEPNKEAARPFIENHGVIWPSLFDPDGRTRKLIGMGVPVTWFIDASGKVIYKKVGAFKDAKEIESLAKKHFNLQ